MYFTESIITLKDIISSCTYVRALVRHYRLEIVVIVRTDKSIQVIKKIILRCPKIFLCRICERVFFFPLNLHTSEVSLALGELFLIGFCVFSVLIFLRIWFFSFFNIRFFYLTEKVFFGQFLVFLQLSRRRPSVPSLSGVVFSVNLVQSNLDYPDSLGLE